MQQQRDRRSSRSIYAFLFLLSLFFLRRTKFPSIDSFEKRTHFYTRHFFSIQFWRKNILLEFCHRESTHTYSKRYPWITLSQLSEGSYPWCAGAAGERRIMAKKVYYKAWTTSDDITHTLAVHGPKVQQECVWGMDMVSSLSLSLSSSGQLWRRRLWTLGVKGSINIYKKMKKETECWSSASDTKDMARTRRSSFTGGVSLYYS